MRVMNPPAEILSCCRRELLLVEARLGDDDTFRSFFRRQFDLDQTGLARPGYVCTPGGRWLELVFLGRSGEPFPSGVEINALSAALEPLDEAAAEVDLADFMAWMFEGAGLPWSLAAWRDTARLYHLPSNHEGGHDG